ncbi:MAG: hypothetical protein QM713_00820 [Arachnia sp.]
MAPHTDAPLRFGANYTPSRDWFHSWLSLDLSSVRRDLEALAALGLDHIRVFPLWPVLQPNRTLIRREALDDVRRVVDVAADCGLDASVDVIQGHLSSFDFVPSWLATWHDRNMFTDPASVAAQVSLVEALGERLADAPNFLGLTLGNETNQFSAATHPSPWPVTGPEAEGWIVRLLEAAERSAPGRDHVHAEYDAVWFMDGHGFEPAHAARLGAMTTIHSWVFNGTAQRYGGRSVASHHLAEYLIELSRAFSTDLERPVWLQEVGAPSNCLEEAQQPGFITHTLRNAATTENLWGVTWWCSHDVSRSLGDFPELEYSLGLIDQEGRVKANGRRYAELIQELRPRRAVPQRSLGIVVEVDERDVPLSRGSLSPGGVVFESWVAACADKARPALVTSTVAADESLLAARGITELVWPSLSANQVDEYSSVNTVVA